MDSGIERMVRATGATVPLAARIVSLVLDSGASQAEVTSALSIVEIVLARLPITYDHQLTEKLEQNAAAE
jgi:hypothetical protein